MALRATYFLSVIYGDPVQHLYDTTCLRVDFWVKLVWDLGCWVNKQQKQKQFVPRIFFDDTILERSCQEIILIMNCQPSSCANFSAIAGSDIS